MEIGREQGIVKGIGEYMDIGVADTRGGSQRQSRRCRSLLQRGGAYIIGDGCPCDCFRDVLLLETGFICCLGPPALALGSQFSTTLVLALLRLLLFKVLFSSAVSKCCTPVSLYLPCFFLPLRAINGFHRNPTFFFSGAP